MALLIKQVQNTVIYGLTLLSRKSFDTVKSPLLREEFFSTFPASVQHQTRSTSTQEMN
jgi:hypothetical protein